jgi:hypothetical protein
MQNKFAAGKTQSYKNRHFANLPKTSQQMAVATNPPLSIKDSFDISL